MAIYFKRFIQTKSLLINRRRISGIIPCHLGLHLSKLTADTTHMHSTVATHVLIVSLMQEPCPALDILVQQYDKITLITKPMLQKFGTLTR